MRCLRCGPMRSCQMPEPFRIPDGKMIATCRHKVKRPRVIGFRVKDNTLFVKLSCGHEKRYCRLPTWAKCYQCPVETIRSERPANGYREIPFISIRPQ